MAYYCDASHQLEDRSRHKEGCNKVKKSRKSLDKEEKQLRDMFAPPGAFVDGVGNFDGIPETNGYQSAQYKLAKDLLQVFGGPGGKLAAVQEAMDHLVDLNRLCGGDRLRVRHNVPHLYLRLGKDQEAYDFLRDFVQERDEEEPKADVLEDLQAAQNAARALDGSMPPEIIYLVRGQLVGSIVKSRPELLLSGTEKFSALIEKIKGRIIALYRSANAYNPQFWRLMNSDPIQASREWTGGFSRQTKDEACMWIGYCVAAWAETPGDFDVMKLLSKTV